MPQTTTNLATNTYSWISDPGHGWLKVPVADVRASGATISDFSYTDGTHAYLEEDLDAWAFVEAAGIPVAGVRDWPDHRGNPRSLPRYR